MTHSAPMTRASVRWRRWVISELRRRARSDAVAFSRARRSLSRRPGVTGAAIIPRSSASMLMLQSRIRSPTRPRPIKITDRREKTTAKLTARRGKISKKNSDQDGRSTMMAAKNGASRSKNPDRSIIVGWPREFQPRVSQPRSPSENIQRALTGRLVLRDGTSRTDFIRVICAGKATLRQETLRQRVSHVGSVQQQTASLPAAIGADLRLRNGLLRPALSAGQDSASARHRM